MAKLNNPVLAKVQKVDEGWIKKTDYALEHSEALRVNTLIVLKIRQYMKAHNMKQVDLARKLGVSPQYVNKFLRGQEPNIGLETLVRYGNILGIKLIEVPGYSENEGRTVEVLRETFKTRNKIQDMHSVMSVDYHNLSYFQKRIKNKNNYECRVS